MDFEVQRFTRRCAATDRELAPGELFYSVLLAEGAEVVRHDYAAEAWNGPPVEALGWWKSQLPAADAKPKKPQWAPNDVMLRLFDELAERPEVSRVDATCFARLCCAAVCCDWKKLRWLELIKR